MYSDDDSVWEAAKAPTATASLGVLLRHYRRRAGLTQEELAERAGMSVRGIGNIERDVPQRVRKETLRLLTEALNLAPTERTAFLELARKDTAPAARESRRAPEASTGAIAAPDAHVPPLRTAVPSPVTPLVGRTHELTMARDYIRRNGPRLLTFCGPGGVGKTRLAVELVRECAADFADGVGFVPLAPIGDANLVGLTIMRHLGLRATGAEEAIAVLCDHLAKKHILLLLDNFEHVLAAGPLIARLIASCPLLKVLVTSRSPLRLQGEQQFAVPPLEVPEAEMAQCVAIETLSQVGAIAFFLQRAREIVPNFTLTAENADPIVQICQRLDGLPLAIELATTRLGMFSVQELSVRLEHRLPLLMGGAQDLPARQQTLRNTLAWSYRLLQPEQQSLFRSLAVFVGGCSWDALQAICAPLAAKSVGEDAEGSLVTQVACLLDHHLLQRIQMRDGTSRYRLLKTIREFAQELLAMSGENTRIEQAHASYYLAQAESIEPLLRGRQQKEWLDWLDMEHDNLRAALQWMLQQRDGVLALRLAAAMAWFWYVRGYFSEGSNWLEKALAMSEPTTLSADPEAPDMPVLAMKSTDTAMLALARWQALRAKAFHGAGLLAYYQGDYQKARTMNEEALALRRVLDDQRGISHTANNLALVLTRQGDIAGAATLYEESLILKRKVGDVEHIATTLANLGKVYVDHGDYVNAKQVYERCLDQWRTQGDDHNVARTLANLGEIALREGHYERAAVLLEDSLNMRHRLGDKGGLANTIHLLGTLAYAQGNSARALTCYKESCEILLEVGGDKRGIVSNLEALAILLCTELEVEHAVWLSSAAAAFREKHPIHIKPFEQKAIEWTLALERAALDDISFTKAWEKGAFMTLDEIWEVIRSSTIASESTTPELPVVPLYHPSRENREGLH